MVTMSSTALGQHVRTTALLVFLVSLEASCGFFHPTTVAPPSAVKSAGRGNGHRLQPGGGADVRGPSCASRCPPRRGSRLSATSGNETLAAATPEGGDEDAPTGEPVESDRWLGPQPTTTQGDAKKAVQDSVWRNNNVPAFDRLFDADSEFAAAVTSATDAAGDMWDVVVKEMRITSPFEGGGGTTPDATTAFPDVLLGETIPQAIQQEVGLAFETAKVLWTEFDTTTKAFLAVVPLLGAAAVGGRFVDIGALNPLSDPAAQLSLVLVLLLGAPELTLSAGAKIAAETEQIVNRLTGGADGPGLLSSGQDPKLIGPGSLSSGRDQKLIGPAKTEAEDPRTSALTKYLLPETRKMQMELDELATKIDAVEDLIVEVNSTNGEKKRPKELVNTYGSADATEYPHAKRKDIDAPGLIKSDRTDADVVMPSVPAPPLVDMEMIPAERVPILTNKTDPVPDSNSASPAVVQSQASSVPAETISTFSIPADTTAPVPQMGNANVALVRRKKLVFDYKVAAAAFAAASLSTLGFSGGYVSSALLSASGPVLASGTAWILGDAAEHGRLGSDTYKRLNLALAAFSLCSLLTGILSLSSYNARDLAFSGAFLASILALSPAIKGWAYGVGGIDSGTRMQLFLPELMKGALRSMLGFARVRNLKSAGYLAAMIFAGVTKALALFEITNLLRAEADCRVVVMRLARLARFILLTAVSFTLKDAADRDQLDGKTFIRLNLLSAFAFGSIAVSAYKDLGGLVGPAARAFACSAYCLYNGAVSLMRNKRIER